MIFITGDCHSDFTKFNTTFFPEQREMIKDDYVIICGDFGGVWDADGETPFERYWLDWLDEDKPFTTLFVDGNHENFERLVEYPETEWMGGKIHEIRPSVFHLMRGEIFTLQGRTFFAFGGAKSHDISDGILDRKDFNSDKELFQKINQYNKDGKLFRVNHMSWWKEEEASETEMRNGIKNLEKYNNKVDFIITHCAPKSVVSLLTYGIQNEKMLDYFETIKDTVKFHRWYFGHYHIDKRTPFDQRFICHYDGIERIV